MKYSTAWLALAAGLYAAAALGGCSRVAVHTIVDPEADFASYSTFDFLPNGGPKGGPTHGRTLRDPLYYSYVQEAIAEVLAEKGLKRVHGNADLVIAYKALTRRQAEVLPPIYGVGWRGRVYVVAPGHVAWYREGTLVIDVIDTRTRHTVWRGVGTGAMRDMRPGEDLKAAVREVMERFPMQRAVND